LAKTSGYLVKMKEESKKIREKLMTNLITLNHYLEKLNLWYLVTINRLKYFETSMQNHLKENIKGKPKSILSHIKSQYCMKNSFLLSYKNHLLHLRKKPGKKNHSELPKYKRRNGKIEF